MEQSLWSINSHLCLNYWLKFSTWFRESSPGLVTICVKQKFLEWKWTLAAKDSTATYNIYVTHWSAIEYLSEKTLLPGPLYLFKPRKAYPIPQKLTLTTVVECWNLCIMHLWRNMQIRANLLFCQWAWRSSSRPEPIRIMMIIIMSIINDHDLFDSIIYYKRDLSIIKIMVFFSLFTDLEQAKKP